jgi:hydroxymethylglutaryl-CoA lyase
MQEIDVLVSEVGPRDGLQSIKRIMPSADKLRWIAALAAAGVREIEVGSFVPARLLPQMADVAEVVRGSAQIPGLNVLALAPNLRGVQDAAAAGANAVSLPVSASRAHSQSNLRKTPEAAMHEVGRICDWRASLPPARRFVVEANVATAFGCTMEGPVSEDWVIDMANQLAKNGADAVGLSDTTGYANPAQVRRLFTRLRRELGDKVGGAHLHNTRGLGIANALAALEAGVTTLDASQGGIGGCPYAPGATGNIVTEDLVFMLEAMGLRTGIDIEKLVAARQIVLESLPGEPLYGHLPDAGLTRGFVPAKVARQAHA